MNIDNYSRKIDYLRLSVTDRCNLRCRYCMPEDGVENIGHENILTLEEMTRLVKIAAFCGVSRVRLTGGEPLVRKNVTKLIAQIAAIPGIVDIALTTNGILFADMAQELKDSGLTRVNFSLDSLDKEKFNNITGGGDLSRTFASVQKALSVQMEPVKINVVAMKGFNDNEILDFVKLTAQQPLHVRFIEFMPVGDLPFFSAVGTFTIKNIKDIIEREYKLIPIVPVKGSGPANYYRTEGAAGTVGFIGAMSEGICQRCNRIRLTADGKLRGCLYAGAEIDVKTALRQGREDTVIADLFKDAILTKPHRHEMNQGWGKNNKRKMSQIGG